MSTVSQFQHAFFYIGISSAVLSLSTHMAILQVSLGVVYPVYGEVSGYLYPYSFLLLWSPNVGAATDS